jgi:type I restriction enzyme, S subunit
MISELKLYPAMKDSGVEWLGEVPEHWEVRRLKTLLAVPVTDGPHLTPDFLSQGIPFLSVDSLQNGELVFKNCRYVSPEDHAEFKRKTAPRLGDILLGKAASTGKIARVKVDFEFSIWSPLALIRPDVSLITSAFLENALKDVSAQAQIETLCTLNTQKNISMDDIPKLVLPHPPFPEQAAIVRYLNYVDRRVQRYILAKRKLAKLLEEQKQAIIHRAITRGLDPHVPMKDSGVKWLGEVPKHWEVVRLKFIADRIVDCLHATPRYSDSGIFPAIRTADISPGVVRLESARRIKSDEFQRWTQRLEPTEGDILYSREGERFGIAACVPRGARLCISQRMMVFRIRSEHNPSFVMFLLNTPELYTQASQDIMGATAPHVNVSTIRNYALAMPGRSEQDSIIAHIEKSTANFTQTIDAFRQEITLMTEYRTRLMADVVTGKLDVREAAANLPDEPESLDEPETLLNNGDGQSENPNNTPEDVET